MLTESFIKSFTAGYVEALLWSSVVLVDGDHVNADNFEMSTAGADACRADCLAFCTAHAALIEKATSIGDDYDAEHAGHDFALTRNGHGSGFWDRNNLPQDICDALTLAAQACGEANVYELDGEICIS